MTPIEFPQQTMILAKDQPQYQPLPVFMDGVETVSCWRLTIVERLTLLFTGKLWLRQMNFEQPLQPQLPTVEYPFGTVELPDPGQPL
jgi:hypothetical protein